MAFLHKTDDDPYCQIRQRLKLKKVGETTRPLRYDLNQIP